MLEQTQWSPARPIVPPWTVVTACILCLPFPRVPSVPGLITSPHLKQDSQLGPRRVRQVGVGSYSYSSSVVSLQNYPVVIEVCICQRGRAQICRWMLTKSQEAVSPLMYTGVQEKLPSPTFAILLRCLQNVKLTRPGLMINPVAVSITVTQVLQ